ncbi:hypothetical protein IPT68_24805 [Streptomyces chromofuscus]|uniref:Uncharacterized protein n=2 Tax=Streptomyces chromofuscus TaxID=42881 RepID=A0A7M2TJ98_STRCW|nr:hypothetical protein IPT68_24805 [Streptomyces chromofuscus]
MFRLATLDGSQYTAVPGSRPALELLASVVSAASLAASDLACALEANPLEGAPFPGPPGAPFPSSPADDAAVRTARHAEAVPAMAEHLADAAHHLDLAHTGCYYLAGGITRDLKQHTEQAQATSAPRITGSQYAALSALSQGGGRLYMSGRKGNLRASTTGGITLNITTFNALNVRGLVRVDATRSLVQGQRINVTAEGERALAQHKPTTAPARAAAVAPPATQQAAGRRR